MQKHFAYISYLLQYDLSYLRIFFLLTTMLLAGNCFADSPSASDSINKKNSVLRVAGWDVYADPNNNNKTIGYRRFEQEFGVTIEFTPLSNLDDIISAAESSSKYDIIIISNEGINILADMGVSQPLNIKKIPNYKNLYPNLKTNKWIKNNNQIYAVPWAWGPTGLLYDTEKVPKPDSWKILWDKKYQGKISLWDDVSMIWTTALTLGYENIYNLTSQQLKTVKTRLLELNDQVYGYYSGGNQAEQYINNNHATILNSWYDPSNRLIQSGKKFKMIIPKEGAVGMFDSYVIHSKTNKSDLAYKYINHQLNKYTQKEMFRVTGLIPANKNTKALLAPQEKSIYPDNIEEYYNKMILWDVMPRKHLYEKVLTEVRDDLNKKNKAISELKLTEAEKKWLETNPEVKFTGDPNWLPYEAFKPDGTYIGIVSEHIDLIAEKTGLKFKMSPSKTWTESTKKAKEGLVDVISETDDSSLSSHLFFTTPYITNPIVIVMSSKENYTESIEKIKNNKIALIKDYGYTAKIRKKYPGINFITVDDIQSGLLAVSTGEADALLCTHTLCSYTIKELGLSDVRITGKTEFDTKLALGVKKNKPELLSILNKAIALITPSEQQSIFDNWIKSKYSEKTDYTLVYQVITFFILLLIVFIFWNRSLSKEINLRRITEKELGQFKHALDQTLDCVFMFTVTDLKFIYANLGAMNQVGYSLDELLKMHPYDIKPDFNEQQFKVLVEPLLKSNNKSFVFETRHQHKSGKVIPVEIFLQHIKSEQDDERFVAIVKDISEAKAIENERKNQHELLEHQVELRTAELINARDEAERANASKSEFLSRMSHELRTPLNAILGFSQILELNHNGSFTQDDLDSINEISIAGNHLLELINEVLDLAQIETGHLKLKVENIDIKKVIAESISLVKPLAAKSNIEIKYATEKDSVYVFADRVRIKQIIINLLSNAIKYNIENGIIEISCKMINNNLQVSIKDTGIGIPENQQPHVFEPFERLHAHTTGIEGTGIGLALSRKLINLMDGDISFTSTEKKGSTFKIIMKLGEKPAAETKPGNPLDVETVPGKQTSILYVEDNPANLRLVSHILEDHHDITLYDAIDGPSAIDQLSSNQSFDIILLDIELPGDIKGHDILKVIRENPDISATPVIAVSANAIEHDIKAGLEAGFDEYITKPIKIKHFVETIRSYIK